VSTPTPAPGERVELHLVRDLVALGVPLPFKVLDAQGRLLLAAGQTIASEAQYEQLMQRGASVLVEAVQQERAARAAAAGGDARMALLSTRKLSLFDRWEQRIGQLDGLLKRLAKMPGQGPDLLAFLDDTIALIRRDPDVAMYMALRRDHSRLRLYPVVHALDCATVAVLTATGMGMNEAMSRSLAGAALTMNVSMVELQAAMAEQDDKPTQRQIEQIRSHPERAVKLLEEAGIADAAWLGAVAQHHERADGSGYPAGLTAPHPAARLLRAADVFMAKVTPRALRPALRVQEAARQLFAEEKGGPVAGALIKAVGVYPPGEIVELKSGEQAVVARRGSGGNTPRVSVFLDRQGRPVAGTTLVDTFEAERAVVGIVADLGRLPRLMPERVYGWIDG
jgi:HD-GYP domain-containing protein (c-di-GMP phosphodiesterase class II)